jgi:hypothetical protein
MGGAQPTRASQEGKEAQPPVIDARQVRIRDASGRVRIRLGISQSGAPMINLGNKEGQRIASLWEDDAGNPHFSLYDSSGTSRLDTTLAGEPRGTYINLYEPSSAGRKRRMMLGVTPNGSPMVALYDRQQKSRIICDVAPDGQYSQQVLYDAQSRVREQTSVAADGLTIVRHAGPEGEDRQVLETSADGTRSRHELFSTPGRGSLRLMATEAMQAMGYFDTQGHDRITVAHASGREAAITLWNAKANGGIQMIARDGSNQGGFLLRDLNGQPRGSLEMLDNGTPRINLFNAEGQRFFGDP